MEKFLTNPLKAPITTKTSTPKRKCSRGKPALKSKQKKGIGIKIYEDPCLKNETSENCSAKVAAEANHKETQVDSTYCVCTCSKSAKDLKKELVDPGTLTLNDFNKKEMKITENWKEIEEKTRKELNDSFKENKELCEELERLKERKVDLEKTASDADYYALLLKVMLDAAEEDSGIADVDKSLNSSKD